MLPNRKYTTWKRYNFDIASGVEITQSYALQLELNYDITHSLDMTQQQPRRDASNSVTFDQDAVRAFDQSISQSVAFTQGFTLQASVPVESAVVISHTVSLLKINNIDVSQSLVIDGD
jgi:hypothetical protein